MKEIKKLKLIARKSGKFGKILAFRKLKENYLSQKANVECGNRYPDDGKSLFIIIVAEFSFFSLSRYKLHLFGTAFSDFMYFYLNLITKIVLFSVN